MTGLHIATESGGKTVTFTIDNDEFRALPAVGGGLIDDLLNLDEFGDLLNLKPEEATVAQMRELLAAKKTYDLKLMGFLDLVLDEESALRWAARYRSVDQPITRAHAQTVIKYLVEQYSKPHPTEPPSPSTPGLGGTNVNSMGGALPAT